MKHENWQYNKTHSLYLPSQNPERFVVFNPGWLGEHTLSESIVEEAVGELSVGIAIVHQTGGDRRCRLHNVLKEVSDKTEFKEVEIGTHSLGYLDTAEVVKHHKDRQPPPYKINNVTAYDAVGSNGKRVNVEAFFEVVNIVIDRSTLGVVVKSGKNFIRRPFRQAYEAGRAYSVSTSDELDRACYDAGVGLNFVFHDGDRVVTAPSDKRVNQLESRGSKVSVLPGGHLATVCHADTLQTGLAA